MNARWDVIERVHLLHGKFGSAERFRLIELIKTIHAQDMELTWDELRNRLIAEFKGEADLDALEERINALKQKTGESYKIWSERVLAKYIRAYCKPPSPAELERLTLKSLNYHYKYHHGTLSYENAFDLKAQMAAWERTEWKKLDLAGPEEEERTSSFRAKVEQASPPQPPARSYARDPHPQDARDLTPSIFALERIAASLTALPPRTPPAAPAAQQPAPEERKHDGRGRRGNVRRDRRSRAPQDDERVEKPSARSDSEQTRGRGQWRGRGRGRGIGRGRGGEPAEAHHSEDEPGDRGGRGGWPSKKGRSENDHGGRRRDGRSRVERPPIHM